MALAWVSNSTVLDGININVDQNAEIDIINFITAPINLYIKKDIRWFYLYGL